MDQTEDLDATFAALAHPTRRAILARLAEGKANVNALAEPFEMSLPAISKHIRVLEDANLITRERQAQFRPCVLNVDPLKEVISWTEQYRHIWEDRFAAMDDVLQELKGKDHG
jgi:DNA-binding transcriptional ArsR family regulator